MSDIAITPGLVLKSANGQSNTAFAGVGVTITAGQTIYIDPATNLAVLSDANGTTPINAVSGISLNGASPGQPVDWVGADTLLTIGATLTIGSVLYLSSANPGGITATYADVASLSTVINLGTAVTAAAFNFRPNVGGVKP